MAMTVQDTKLKPGYKQTEMGMIPEDWEISSLGDVVIKVGSGITPKGGEKVYKKEGRPFLRSQNVGWGKLLLDDIAFIDEETHSSFLATEIKLNDVLLNITGASIGRSAVADDRLVGGNVNQHVCIIRADRSKLNPYYLNYFLLSKKGQKQIDSFQAGGNRQGLNFGQIKSFQILLPPLSEQQAIAAALSDMDALIASLDKLIAKKRDIKQATMQQLLTGKTRLPGFSGEWEVETLEYVGEKFVNGGTPSTQKPEYWQGNIPWITGADVIDQGILDVRRFITAEAVKYSATNIVENGNLLIVTRTGVGKLAIAPFNVAISQDITGIYVKKGLASIEYLFHYFNYNAETLRSLNQGTSIAGITRETLLSTKVDLPSLSEQQAITTILSDMDAEIAELEQKREKMRALKQGMMQELLTGKTRLL